MRISIRNRILLLFIAVFCIQTLSLGAFFLHQRSIDIKKQSRTQISNSGQNIYSQLSYYFNSILHDLEITGIQVERIAQKNHQQYQLLNNLLKSNRDFYCLAFYDINGIVKNVVSSGHLPDINDYFEHNRGLFDKTFTSGKPFVSNVNTIDEQPVIIIGQPIFFLDHSYVFGVLAAIIRLNTIQSIFDRTILPESQDLTVIDDSGHIVATTFNTYPGEILLPEGSLIPDEVLIDQVNYSAYISSLNFHGQTFTVMSTIGIDEPSYSILGSAATLTIVIILLILLSAAVGWTSRQKIVRPLEKLASVKDADLKLSGGAEIEDVAVALKAMNMQLAVANKNLKIEADRRKQENIKAIAAKTEAEKANQAKSIFLANMSHEIRTPLHSMLAMLQTINKNQLSEKQSRIIALTLSAGENLQSIVDTILDFSKIESGKFHLNSSPFSVLKLLTETVELMQVQTHAKDLTINCTVDSQVPDYLHGDSGRIRQVLINLISNAIKFSAQGTIEITASRLPEETNDPQNVMMLFSVSDCGPGIAEEDEDIIFEAFEQKSDIHGTMKSGAGLGLAISKEFVQQMAGRLWLAKNDTNGSLFSFTIPCTVAKESTAIPDAQDSKRQQHQPLEKLKIMLAEDEFINQRFISAYLEARGAVVTVCTNGQELLDKLKNESTSLILMDIRMPVMNGLEATRAIRKAERDRADCHSVPIIALTAQATTDMKDECVKAGMNDYLTKPIQLDRLVRIIEKYAGLNKKEISL